ncbi:MAG: hypothetical protein ACK559_06790 [bacterium]
MKEKKMIEFYKKRTKVVAVKHFSYLAKDEEIEVAEWGNGGGVDILFNSSMDSRCISLTYPEVQALQMLLAAPWEE